MNLLFIADLHIRHTQDSVYLSLLRVLREKVSAEDVVILGGDLFDLFVGNKKVFRSRFKDFLEAVREAGEKGVQIHYIEGNHDFLLRGVFKGFKGVTVHPECVELELHGKRFFMAHGDKVDFNDYGYLLLRFFFRSPLMKLLVYLVPGAWLEQIGKMSSNRSRGQRPLLPAELPAGAMEKLRKTYRNFAVDQLMKGYDFVVLGHCHDLDEMSFTLGSRKGQYVNVGFPRVHGSYLSWSRGDEKIQRERFL